MKSRLGTNVISVITLGILWEIAGRTADSALIPPVSKIASAWLRLLASGKLLDNLIMSLGTLAAGFFLALIVGILLGVLMGRFHERHDVLVTPTLPIPAFTAGREARTNGRISSRITGVADSANGRSASFAGRSVFMKATSASTSAGFRFLP